MSVATGVILSASVAQGVVAHSGHGHADGSSGGVLLPAAILLGSGAVLGTSVYLDRRGEIEGWMVRAAHLLAVLGLLAGTLLALF